MCGRFTNYSNPKQIAKIFGINQVRDFSASYNVAPTDPIQVIVNLSNDHRKMVPMRWGLIPSWQKDPKLGMPLINARAETIDTKPAFKNAIKYRRCIIIANGFYEWKIIQGVKQPFYIHMKNDEPFGIAGIWERWIKEETAIDSCSIITTDANEKLTELHDRMPAILESNDYSAWLNTEVKSWLSVKNLIKPFPEDCLEVYPVSTFVNSVKNNSINCINGIDLK